MYNIIPKIFYVITVDSSFFVHKFKVSDDDFKRKIKIKKLKHF